VKSPSVIHFKCLDTFALQGVKRSFGSGAPGVRLTGKGLATYMAPSRRHVSEEDKEARAESARIDELLARDEKCDTLIPQVTDAAPSVILPPPRVRASMPSLVTIEMSLRKPTTWAVVLLTLGVSFGVGLARVASNAAMPTPVVSAAAAPRIDVARVIVPRTVQPGPIARAPVTIAMTTIVGHPHHHHASLAAAAQTDVASPPLPVAEKHDDGDETSAAAAASERAHSELSNSL